MLLLLLAAVSMSTSTTAGLTVEDQARRIAAPHSFDATIWLVDAGTAKLSALSLGENRYVTQPEGVQLVKRYRSLLQEEAVLRGELDAALAAAEAQAEALLAELASLQGAQSNIQLAVESALQRQATSVLEDAGLGTVGVLFPPLTFHFSELPRALIVSPRATIRQDANILLDPAITVEEQITLEERIESGMDVAALVVGIGGLGYYPTMVMETSSMNWIAEVIIHEWVHNFLNMRPLGLNYNTSPELRTMNETAANLIGKTLGARLIEEYYPAWVPQPPADPAPAALDEGSMDAPSDETVVFDFRLEMYNTRLEVDRLLAAGDVDGAEAYMEQRRQVFVQNGYPIRRLNQAYFAFHGAYADEGISAAGEDPVGEAVRRLWTLSESPADFLRTMAWMDSYDDLLAALSLLEGPASAGHH